MDSSLRRRALLALAWIAAIWIAWEFTHYQQYKLTGHPGSTQLFGILSEWLGTPGGEKPFRLFVASMEIAATVLVLIPRTQWFGGLFSSGIMAGAIFFHTVSPLGIDPYGDGGILFREAVITFFAGLLIVAIRRDEAFAFARRIGVLRAA
jgi:uncharacterized membrane protein YphA (DoxX/SURF4 family)